MANWRPVDVRVWNDRKFLSCCDEARLLWLFLLTCPSLPIPGVIVGGDAALAELMGWSPERLRERFAELSRNGLRVRREARIVWLPNALKYQPPSNPNMVKSWGKKWDDVPEGELKVELWEAVRIACKSWSVLFGKLFPKPLLDGSSNGSVNGSGNCSAHKHQHDHDHKNQHDLEEPPIPPKGGARSRARSRPSDPTPDERAAFDRVMDRLRKETGIAYRGSAAHLRLVVARLREGVHELELRAVIAFCAGKWDGKPDMADYLRPETLFGPTTIHRYLDAARTKYAEDIAREMAKTEAPAPPEPKLELVS